MTLEFMKDAGNVVLVGPNGVGKPLCAANIGYQAVLSGHTVLFTTPASCWATWLRWTATRPCAGGCANTPHRTCC